VRQVNPVETRKPPRRRVFQVLDVIEARYAKWFINLSKKGRARIAIPARPIIARR